MTGALFFADRCVMVTGAGRGIGRAYAIELARRGAAVAVNDICAESARDVVAEIIVSGGTAHAVVADTANAAQCRDIVNDVVAKFGGVDAVIVNASINSKRKPFLDLTLDDLRAMLEVNVFGARRGPT